MIEKANGSPAGGTVLTAAEEAHALATRAATLTAIEKRAAEVKARIPDSLPCNCGRTVTYAQANRHLGAVCESCGGSSPKIARPAWLGPMSDREKRTGNLDAHRREKAPIWKEEAEAELHRLREHYRETRSLPLSDFFSPDPTRTMRRASVRASLMSGWKSGEKAQAELNELRPTNCSDCGTIKPAAERCPNCRKDPRFNRVFRR